MERRSVRAGMKPSSSRLIACAQSSAFLEIGSFLVCFIRRMCSGISGSFAPCGRGFIGLS